MKESSTTKLENLLEQVSEEMINLYKEGYEVRVSLPFSKDDGCSVSVYKPTVILKSQNGDYGMSDTRYVTSEGIIISKD